MTLCDITVNTTAGITHVVLTGEIDLSNSPTVAATITACIADPAATTVLLDLTGLTFIDASGIRALTNSWRHAHRCRKTLRATGAAAHVSTVLEILGIAELLEMDDTDHPVPAACRQ